MAYCHTSYKCIPGSMTYCLISPRPGSMTYRPTPPSHRQYDLLPHPSPSSGSMTYCPAQLIPGSMTYCPAPPIPRQYDLLPHTTYMYSWQYDLPPHTTSSRQYALPPHIPWPLQLLLPPCRNIIISFRRGIDLVPPFPFWQYVLLPLLPPLVVYRLITRPPPLRSILRNTYPLAAG